MSETILAARFGAIAESLVAASKFVEGDLVVVEQDGKKVEVEVVDVSREGSKWVYKLEKIEKPVPENELKRASLKTAAARGPVTNALKKWNDLHDIERELEEAGHEYDIAASYAGSKGAEEAKKVMEHIDMVKGALEKISFGLFSTLIEHEMAFVRKFGTPREFADIRMRLPRSDIANKIARSLTAGVSVFVKDFKSKDLYWVQNSVRQGLRGFGEQNYSLDLDGGSYGENHTGTVNVYVKNPDFADKIFRDLSNWVGHLHLVGINGRVRLETSKSTQGPVVRVEIIKNEDEKFGNMESTSITYSTWRLVLDWLGFSGDVDEQVGSMPIRDYLAAFRHPAPHYADDKVAVFAQQIARMATTALKHGYKEIAWA